MAMKSMYVDVKCTVFVDHKIMWWQENTLYNPVSIENVISMRKKEINVFQWSGRFWA